MKNFRYWLLLRNLERLESLGLSHSQQAWAYMNQGRHSHGDKHMKVSEEYMRKASVLREKLPG